MTTRRRDSVGALAALLLAALLPVPGSAAPMVYKVDPDHTHPLFEADHFGGMSVWRGLFSTSSGKIIFDKTDQTGNVDISVDTAHVETGQNQLDKVIAGPEFLDAANYPVAHYTGKLVDFVKGEPTAVTGSLTLHGITRPLTLKILSFKCMSHPVFKREVCGADALAQFDRADFGIDMGKQYGFRMQTTLRIQVEAIAVK
jgi:polyisoprenoid-binding protein YceI